MAGQSISEELNSAIIYTNDPLVVPYTSFSQLFSAFEFSPTCVAVMSHFWTESGTKSFPVPSGMEQ